MIKSGLHVENQQFLRKNGCFLEKYRKKSGGPFKNWLYFAPNLLYNEKQEHEVVGNYVSNRAIFFDFP